MSPYRASLSDVSCWRLDEREDLLGPASKAALRRRQYSYTALETPPPQRDRVYRRLGLNVSNPIPPALHYTCNCQDEAHNGRALAIAVLLHQVITGWSAILTHYENMVARFTKLSPQGYLAKKPLFTEMARPSSAA